MNSRQAHSAFRCTKVIIGLAEREATEVWTFMRTRGGHWLLSAIQQA